MPPGCFSPRTLVPVLPVSEPLEPRLSNVQTGWERAGVAEDLGDVSLADPFDALILIRQSIEIDRNRAASHNLLGAIHANLGQWPEARAAFDARSRVGGGSAGLAQAR